MAMFTVEGIVGNGQIKLHDPIVLLEHTRCSSSFLTRRRRSKARIRTPRLAAHPEQAIDFAKKVIQGPDDDGL